MATHRTWGAVFLFIGLLAVGVSLALYFATSSTITDEEFVDETNVETFIIEVRFTISQRSAITDMLTIENDSS